MIHEKSNIYRVVRGVCLKLQNHVDRSGRMSAMSPLKQGECSLNAASERRVSSVTFTCVS